MDEEARAPHSWQEAELPASSSPLFPSEQPAVPEESRGMVPLSCRGQGLGRIPSQGNLQSPFQWKARPALCILSKPFSSPVPKASLARLVLGGSSRCESSALWLRSGSAFHVGTQNTREPVSFSCREATVREARINFCPSLKNDVRPFLVMILHAAASLEQQDIPTNVF